MGCFLFLPGNFAIDLGTANTIIMKTIKLSLTSLPLLPLIRPQETGCYGSEARQMHGKTHENIRTIRRSGMV